MGPLTAGLSAVGTFVAAASLAIFGAPRVVVVHLIFAAGILPLVLAAILHFVPVLTRTGSASRGMMSVPALAMVAGWGVAATLAGWLPASALALLAVLDAAMALLLIRWIVVRARATVGAPHPGTRWYVGSLALLAIALLAIASIAFLPEAYRPLRTLHLHLNTLGFLGMAALGTLPVLLPTALGRRDAGAAAWLVRSRGRFLVAVMLVALAATAMTAGFSVVATALGLVGFALLSAMVVGLLRHWLRDLKRSAISTPAAAVALIAAACGFQVMILLGLLHGLGLVAADTSVPAFFGLFLLPLVTGALTQLLPVWRFPGPETAARRGLHAALARFTALRVACFQLGGILFAAALPQVALFALCAGLVLFVAALVQGFSGFPAAGG
jgi:hypothetical protein